MSLEMTPLFLKRIKRVLICVLFFLCHTYAFSQINVLEKEINIPEFKGSAKQLISQIESAEKLVFAYTSSISLAYEVSFTNKQMKLKDFLDTLFSQKSIAYKVKGNKIILYTNNTNTSTSLILQQTVRGSIVDADSRLPIIGATISIPDSDPLIGTVSDLNGNFRFDKIPVGRINLQLSCIGYKTNYISNVEVNSGKEVVLFFTMHESATKISEVVITLGKKKGEALNDMALLSARSISVEESLPILNGH
jgi:hypothetical protein